MVKQQGFTLIEVLIALAILTIALTTVMQTVNIALHNSAELQDKTLANWVADNVIANTQLGIIPLSRAGEQHAGVMRMLAKNWYWQLSGRAAALPQLQHIEVIVRRSPQGRDVIRRTGIISQVGNEQL